MPFSFAPARLAPVLLLEGLSGALVGIGLLYLLGVLAAGRWLDADPYELLLCMAAAFLVAVVCEWGSAGLTSCWSARHCGNTASGRSTPALPRR